MRRLSRWLGVLLLCAPAAAVADDLERKLAAYEVEARQIGTNLPEPGKISPATGQRRLVDAEVAFALGDYDTAALMLFDLANKPGPDQITALYYLGESLFQKGDKGAARTYFEQIAGAPGSTSRYYQPALLRLVEIAIAQRDSSTTDKQIAALDAIPAAARTPEVSYVRGKYAYSQDKFDDAIRYFGEVPKGSSRDYQAAYYTATALVAKKDLARATEVLTELIGRKPRGANDRRVIELGQLALGRIYYERDQPSKSIDSYLMIDRRSDLFPDALYEVAWVYVKGKQYDKALRALELLNLSEPTSLKTPTVRILEGNLRIRKAQMIRQKVIDGTVEKDGPTDPTVEYDRAAAVFTETHDIYLPSYQALERMVDSGGDPAQYLAQIAGRSPTIFQATAPIPEAAAAYLREEPEVQRVVAVETDLATIESDLAESEATIARLEGVLAAGDRTAVYPALQSRRARIGQIQDDLNKLRGELADRQAGLADGMTATVTRKNLAQQLASVPNAEQTHSDRVAQVQRQYDAIEQATAEVSASIDSTQAVAVALRKYALDATPPLPADQKATIAETLDTSAREAATIEKELAEVQREILLGRDLAGVGDDTVAKARDARRQLKAALDAEHRALAAVVSSSRDKSRSQKLSALGERALKISDSLAQTESQIDTLVDRGMQEVKLTLAAERGEVAKYKAELVEQEAESRSIGGTVLGASFRDVKARFYDIVIRTDVGNVDVAWSQKEDADDDLKRLNLSRQRDLKQLRDEFKGILIEEGPAKPKPAPAPAPAPGPDPGSAASPDKGGADARIKPGSDAPAPAPTPTVRPDNEQGKAPAAPKGGTPAPATPKAGTPTPAPATPKGGPPPAPATPKGGTSPAPAPTTPKAGAR
jgi:tetratricopeptide (TPR) repeat protein